MITTNNTVSDELVNKIRKLLALSTSGNEAESELALKKAKELAVQNSIDIEFIQIFENKKSDEPIVKGEDLSLAKRESVCQKFIYWLVQRHFGVQVIVFGNRYYGRRMVFIGIKKDIEIATYVHGFLNQEFMRLWHNYRLTNSDIQTKDRNSYFWGLYSGLSQKLDEQKKETEETTFSALTTTRGIENVNKVRECYALTIVSHKERLAAALNEYYPHLHNSNRYIGNGYHSGSAREAGVAAGRNISLARPLGMGNGGYISA